MRCGLFIALIAGCTASTQSSPDAAVDASPDSVSVVPCPLESTLSICLSFDLPAFGSTLANEGALALTADLQNVSRIGVPPGAAALLSTASTMQFPPNTQITDIVAVDARLRLDEPIPTGLRVGIMDTESAVPGASMFLYDGGTTAPHRIRCNLGGMDLYADTTLAVGTWMEVKCTCIAGTVAIERDGTKLAELDGCAPASGTTDGVQIGQNSRARDGLPPNERFVGAIDRFRMWTAVP